MAFAHFILSSALDPRVIGSNFANDGQSTPVAGQSPSLTTTNNFINFCLNVAAPITNGQQVKTGSCNPIPIGAIPSTDNMPSSKFTNPQNFGTLKANTAFDITMAIQKIQTGNFVNATANYFSAPQQLNSQGQIIGHTHVVIEKLDSLDQKTPTDPKTFAFFKGVNGAAVNGVVTASVDKGLPAGFYKLSSINAAANHQPVIVAIAQHGSLDDVVYFTVTNDGKPASNTTASSSVASESVSATATATGSGVKASASATDSASVSDSVSASVTGSASKATVSATGGASTKGGKNSSAIASATASASDAASSGVASATGAASDTNAVSATESDTAAAETSSAAVKGKGNGKN
ncbi:hypothetical protein DFS33DRAFT_1265747 [Desarmillaria ectypa]|nr:hypothetical protein DFS33DRAFT_1265747 [Desarmillaria ectypa]